MRQAKRTESGSYRAQQIATADPHPLEEFMSHQFTI